jgi:ectoine hydroxylase-related dioxygenase (phytanoyl-CoA dioxygenase family)
MPTSTAARLDAAEIASFHDQGYLGPYPLCPPEEMGATAAEIERVLAQPGPSAANPGVSRHLDQRVVRELATHPEIVARVDDLMGPDLMLWATNFFIKHPGSPEIPWHQDLNYWPIDPLLTITAWIAVDQATIENSCVKLIPGSHRRVVPHVPAGAGKRFSEMADPGAFAREHVVPMAMDAGSFFLFNERILLQSDANSSTRRRIGMTCRFSVPFVRIDHDALHPGHRAILVRGQDHHRLNRYLEPT